MNRALHMPLCVMASLLLSTPHSTVAQDFDQLTRPVASVTDHTLITMLLDALLIPMPDSVRHIEIVDLTANGYGPDDVLTLYPSLETYLLGTNVPRPVQEVMKTWELASDWRLDATIEDSYKVEADAHRRQNAREALSGAIIGAISRYYSGDKIDLRLAREATGLRLEMWNYDPEALRYRVQTQGPTCTTTLPLPQEQRFLFAPRRIVTSFRDAGECVLSHLRDGELLTRPC